jgi:hypothetical protein
VHFNFGSLLPFLSPLLLGLAVSAGHWLGSKIKNPTDAERAAILEKIADGAAALVVALNPKANWTDLLKAVVQAIEAAAGVPTSNSAAIERAAAAALSKLGKTAS